MIRKFPQHSHTCKGIVVTQCYNNRCLPLPIIICLMRIFLSSYIIHDLTWIFDMGHIVSKFNHEDKNSYDRSITCLVELIGSQDKAFAEILGRVAKSTSLDLSESDLQTIIHHTNSSSRLSTPVSRSGKSQASNRPSKRTKRVTDFDSFIDDFSIHRESIKTTLRSSHQWKQQPMSFWGLQPLCNLPLGETIDTTFGYLGNFKNQKFISSIQRRLVLIKVNDIHVIISENIPSAIADSEFGLKQGTSRSALAFDILSLIWEQKQTSDPKDIGDGDDNHDDGEDDYDDEEDNRDDEKDRPERRDRTPIRAGQRWSQFKLEMIFVLGERYTTFLERCKPAVFQKIVNYCNNLNEEWMKELADIALSVKKAVLGTNTSEDGAIEIIRTHVHKCKGVKRKWDNHDNRSSRKIRNAKKVTLSEDSRTTLSRTEANNRTTTGTSDTINECIQQLPEVGAIGSMNMRIPSESELYNSHQSNEYVDTGNFTSGVQDLDPHQTTSMGGPDNHQNDVPPIDSTTVFTQDINFGQEQVILPTTHQNETTGFNFQGSNRTSRINDPNMIFYGVTESRLNGPNMQPFQNMYLSNYSDRLTQQGFSPTTQVHSSQRPNDPNFSYQEYTSDYRLNDPNFVNQENAIHNFETYDYTAYYQNL
ncbi:hypothetical protein F5884DRAFT_337459 [Xylogone sp. PMI_703]|nr:hypothetical protein F5884DRAFT_337459 [Xylogone sp. PMI_703]